MRFFYWFGKSSIVFLPPVDCSGRREDSYGSMGQGRPRRIETTRRLPGPPVESEAPGTKINRLIYQQIPPVHKSDKTDENSVIYITEWGLLEMV
ncbi:hypothetical protein DYI25_12695 [Mesobacillus boroniphilus]|uniref:Uncharacterized protein n=1 Tax=Mesobacillus boroniphilus TaxID=308892 RepID=A0A944CL17_9BACI|nr:hypothetical protein [Mesobacillus boroniphilus]